jgi:hypothetical protein
MEPIPENNQHVSAESTKEKGVQQPDKAGAAINEKAISEGETLPGWTIMRPLRMRGLKGKGSGSSSAANGAGSANGNNGNSVDPKNISDLKVTETNDSGDGPNGIGEVDALHEVRSDDELLGNNEQGGAIRRGTPGQQSNTGNSGNDVERTLSGREFKVYKRRWFGLAQLVLLNIVVSWDVSTSFHSASSSMQCADTSLSGSPSLRTLQPHHSTTVSPQQPSIGSVQLSSSRSS